MEILYLTNVENVAKKTSKQDEKIRNEKNAVLYLF